MTVDTLAVLIIVGIAVLLLGMMGVVGSFGYLSHRIMRSNLETQTSNRRTQESNELTQNSNAKTRREVDMARSDIADAMQLRKDMLATCPHERSA
jgi:hypothetical protein